MYTNPSVRRDPLSKWRIRLTLRTWRLVGISDRDDRSITRLFFVWCFTVVWVYNYVSVAIVFLSKDRACISGVFIESPPPHITDSSFAQKSGQRPIKDNTRAYKNDHVVFYLFLPISACRVGPQHGCFVYPANENDKSIFSFSCSI